MAESLQENYARGGFGKTLERLPPEAVAHLPRKKDGGINAFGLGLAAVHAQRFTLEELTADGVARVKLHGACQGCAMVPMTMKAGVEEAIKRVAPQVKRVEAVNVGEVV